MIAMPFGVANDGIVTLFTIGVLDHVTELCLRIAFFTGVIIEILLQLVIHKYILNFLSFEETLQHVPVLFDIKFGAVFGADVADIDIATGLMGQMR